MRNGIILAGIAFAVTLAVIVGSKLSSEALAVAVGALCGIAASIPVSIGLVIAASRNWGHNDEGYREVSYDYAAHRYTPQPPQMIFVTPQQSQTPYTYPQGQYYLPANAPMPGAPREFKIVGEE